MELEEVEEMVEMELIFLKVKVLESVNQPGLYRLWHSRGKEVTNELTYDEILKSIVGDDDWDPGVFKWACESEIDFAEWREIDFAPLHFVD